jgi:hypothetical protein
MLKWKFSAYDSKGIPVITMRLLSWVPLYTAIMALTEDQLKEIVSIKIERE